MNKRKKLPPLEQGLVSAMQALDNQVARAMQRTPEERSEQGVQKWEPHMKKVEEVTALVLNFLGDEEVELDSLLVCSQAMTKALQIMIHDLGEAGLGKVRTGYCIGAMENIHTDASRALSTLRSDQRTLT